MSMEGFPNREKKPETQNFLWRSGKSTAWCQQIWTARSRKKDGGERHPIHSGRSKWRLDGKKMKMVTSKRLGHLVDEQRRPH